MLLTAYLINGQTVGTQVQSWSNAELNGNPAFKAENSVSAGYSDISSIENWDRFGLSTGKDTKFIKEEIKAIRIATGYSNLSTSEKVIANKYFASGVEYNNAEVSVAEQNAFFFDFYKPNMDNARKKRDLAVSGYLFKQIFTGVLNQVVVDDLIKDAEKLRTEYLRDGLSGIGYGDTRDGVINFVMNDSFYSPFAIVAVNTGTKTFSIAGDKTATFPTGKILRIQGSTGNNGAYTVVSSSYDATNTNIVVSETVPSATADGSIYHNGLLWYAGLTTTIQTDVYDIYGNGNY